MQFLLWQNSYFGRNVYTIFPQIIIEITIDFQYLPVYLQNKGANEMRVITIKLSKTNPSKKQQKQGVKNFCKNSLDEGMNL